MNPIISGQAVWVWARVLVCAQIVCLVIAVVEACTPAQRAAIPAVERLLCVVLRAATPHAEEICATADELAPFVPDLLAAREAAAERAGAVATSSLVVAYKMPPPRPQARALARRRCAEWAPVDVEAGP